MVRATKDAVSPDAVSGLLRRLTAAGVTTRLRAAGSRYTVGGVTARLDFSRLLAGADRLDSDLGCVYAALRAGIPVTVTIVDPFGAAASDALAEFRRRFFAFLDSAIVDRSLLGLCLSDAEVPSAEFRAAIRGTLGSGPRYIMVQSDRDASAADTVMRLLKDSLGGPAPLWPVFPAGVRSHCPLLASEGPGGVSPGRGIVMPTGTAWLPLDIDVCRFAKADGTVEVSALDTALDTAVDVGDLLIDHVFWFDRRQQCDARKNRRLAVCLSGLGDLVIRQRSDPTDLVCLRGIDQLIGYVHERLWNRSRQLAASRGRAPALDEHRVHRDRCREDSRQHDLMDRWRRAVASVQVRNRNLLVLSPYALLPRSSAVTAAYADLLPALLHADALAFADPPPLRHWKLSDFKSFHLRLQALVERQNAASFVAAGV